MSLTEIERKRELADGGETIKARLDVLGYVESGSFVEIDTYYSPRHVDYLATVAGARRISNGATCGFCASGRNSWRCDGCGVRLPWITTGFPIAGRGGCCRPRWLLRKPGGQHEIPHPGFAGRALHRQCVASGAAGGVLVGHHRVASAPDRGDAPRAGVQGIRVSPAAPN